MCYTTKPNALEHIAKIRLCWVNNSLYRSRTYQSILMAYSWLGGNAIRNVCMYLNICLNLMIYIDILWHFWERYPV